MPKLRHHLKNYFVAHEGNNHIPHTLKPKRLAFHLGAAVIVKAVVFVFITVFPLSAWMSPDMTAQESKKIIALTNNLRTSLSLGALVENSKLTQAATEKVGDMFLNQYFAHVSPAGLGVQTFLKRVGYAYSVAGENLAMGFNTAPEVMTAWEASPTHYANIIDPNYKEIGVAMAGGTYEGTETAFSAQYFGRPSQEITAAVTAPVKKIELPAKSTTLTVQSPVAGTEKVLNVEVKLPEKTTAATAVINNIKVELAPQGNNDNWTGVALISKDDEKAITNPVVPATVEVTDAVGEKALAPLDWNEVQPTKMTAVDHYTVFKSHPSSGMRSIIWFSNIYYGLLLALIATALTGFLIYRKKHHHHILAAGIGAAAFLIFLIGF